MAEYKHLEIEKKWQKNWDDQGVYKVKTDPSKPKFYALDMFPYPSGAGLHVGHPLGYIATDIISRFKRLKGYNVLHPMGFDAFGLPAEQYAIQTGQHPAITTETNITRYKEQLTSLGFSYDWSREVRTSDPSYYKWTQWIFKQLFNSWYNKTADKAERIETLIAEFEANGNSKVNAVCDEDTPAFTAVDWKSWDEQQQQKMLLKYRLTYIAETTVNWCPELGTVLSNDEVKDGFSERGGHPVVKKTMPQWSMRITAYADRLIDGLDTVDWPEPIKDMQRNWIGKSHGAEVDFQIENSDKKITVFTTRIDTIYGVTFMVLAPEADIVEELTTPEQKEKIEAYVAMAKNKSERERMSDVKTISGEFTGSYVINPFSGEKVPVWIADYVLAGYGTGAVMAVPSGDQRDFDFAKHFDLPIVKIIDQQKVTGTEADPTKEGKMINSGMLDGLSPLEAIEKANAYIVEKGIGTPKVNYRIRDAIFGRQRYWGEPIPVYFKDGVPYLLDDDQLPLNLPEVDKYLPTEDGEPPLGRAENWSSADGHPYELTTMPGWAGSSWYFFRYMDPTNEEAFASEEALKYWKQVDFYMGGSEHATGHLLYSRFWTKFLYDMGYIEVDEYAKKLVNQGMIQGRSNFVYRVKNENKYVSHGLRKDFDCYAVHVDVNIVKDDVLDIEAFKKFRPDATDAEFVLEDGKYICGWEVEKMSKSKYNVVNPDDLVSRYGADTLRMYEMFLGPIEQSKPWNTNGIEGVYKFLRKFWGLFHDKSDNFSVSDAAPTKDELKVLHGLLKKIEEDVERLSLNTSVSNFMIAVNELQSLKCNKRAILEPMTIALASFAPHQAEELWSLLGHESTIFDAEFPAFDESHLKEDSFEYPIMVNGKMRAKVQMAADLSKEEIEATALANENVQKWTEGKTPKKVIVVPKKIVNVVV
ncbi:leucine--tRNA ligase [Marinoscillum furvescens]|uniref:Leucine--tRNA ligase n=1 Tax=Marinoscillum furvescens DSM 4134 TaxID=1122208 RepID=A0A3D9L2C8_MARFU|nr:leucine--tRNA ligase [Marinoscillum furvescens]RED95574.1 leucyl-tRNA synthetase [Marinoscillum furvescens DSM 4134]